MKKRRRWWIVAAALVVVAAAVAGGLYWFLGRNTAETVTYLTAEATVGTISDTVEADFTLASGQAVTSIALSGSSTSATSANSTSSTGGVTLASAAAQATGQSPIVLVAARLPVTEPSGSPTPTDTPTPTPTPTPTDTPTPTPTPTGTGMPTPTPTQTGDGWSGSGGGGTTSSTAAASSTSTSASSGISGIVTRTYVPAGVKPRTLQRLLKVSGTSVFAFVSSTPLWKDLSTDLATGEQRANVMALQRALTARGYYKKPINGRFTSATEIAYKAWQADNGMSKTGVVDVDRFVWVPKGSVISSWSVAPGSHVSGGSALASISSPEDLVATALVTQADIGQLKVGQKAEMTIDGYTSDAFTGVITFVGTEPASSSGGATSSGSTQYTITVGTAGLPPAARSGMTGTLTIVIREHADVLLVPTSAVTGTSSTSYVRVMMNGQPVARQVETDMATSAYTEITSGLAEGETVVTGEYTSGATSTGTSSGTNSTNRSGFPGAGLPGGGTVRNGGGAPPAGN